MKSSKRKLAYMVEYRAMVKQMSLNMGVTTRGKPRKHTPIQLERTDAYSGKAAIIASLSTEALGAYLKARFSEDSRLDERIITRLNSVRVPKRMGAECATLQTT